eukprot:g38011.t1
MSRLLGRASSVVRADSVSKRLFSSLDFESVHVKAQIPAQGRTMSDVCIVNGARTPIGDFQGGLSTLSASELGGIAIKGAYKRAGVSPELVDELYLGNVLMAGLGQAPAKQAASLGGLTKDTSCSSVSKVCSSGLKAVHVAAFSIAAHVNNCVIAGGTESMSNTPHILPQGRSGIRIGHGQVIDHCLKDGLWDTFEDMHMGEIAEHCAKEMGITRKQQDEFAQRSYERKQQDEFAQRSYERSAAAWAAGKHNGQVVPVEVKKKGGVSTVSKDEPYVKLNKEKMVSLKSPFLEGGSVTAANSSKISDGAAAVVLADLRWALGHGFHPVARILATGDASLGPKQYPIAPQLAIKKAVARAGLQLKEIDFFEINEAFSVVALANIKLLKLDPAKVNVWGGAVSLGHPVGCSGARILVTLVDVLKTEGGKYGVVGICNGGGEATALVIERITVGTWSINRYQFRRKLGNLHCPEQFVIKLESECFSSNQFKLLEVDTAPESTGRSLKYSQELVWVASEKPPTPDDTRKDKIL